ncbi:MAG: pseudouridine synthase [Hyphomonadaceae bacterium]|nr:pseudouridine synthase [Hyphomonadaceae bacterium]
MAWTKTYAGAEAQRVNKWLAAEGVCSRREAEGLIADGLISIDGARVDDPGRKIEPGQTLTLQDGKRRTPISVVLNKPIGFVSAQPEGDQIPAARLLTAANLQADRASSDAHAGLKARGPVHMPTKHTSLAPLGRLDQDSRGLLVLSEDGVLAKALVGEMSALDKEYLVRVEGRIDENKLELLRHGLVLDHRKLKRAKITQVEPQRLRFVLNEGMKRQIRRMCELVDLEVTDLLRLRIGPLKLGNLQEGKWRALTPAEREALISASK